MKRRKFISYSLGGLAVCSFAGTAVFYKSTKEMAAEIITRKLHFLTLDKVGVKAFVEDYMQNAAQPLLMKVRVAYLMKLPGEQFKYWDELVDNYLLSTDFFRNGMDESSSVKYTGSLYNPYTAPCSQPFSNLYYPEAKLAMLES